MAIIITSTPQKLTPAYNAVNFTFSGNNFTKQGFRYLVDVYSGSTGTTLLSKFKITPLIDGTGKIDISRLLINYLNFNFEPNDALLPDAAPQSYFNYNIKIGEEYQAPSWDFSGTSAFTAGTQTFTRLNGTILPPYIIGDQILVKVPNTASPLYGLHKVTLSGANFIGINIIFQTGSTSGQTFYADGRKVQFSGITGTTGLTVFNGVQSFQNFIDYNADNFILTGSSTTKSALTDLPTTNFYITPEQDLNLNFYLSGSNTTFYKISGATIFGDVFGNAYGSTNKLEVVTFPCGVKSLPISNLNGIDWYEIRLCKQFGLDPFVPFSKTYRIYLDKRCKIEDYEIAFVDRMGSIGSFAFQLRSRELGTINRIQYKQQVPDVYQTTDRGLTNIYVNEQKDLELNTNWMTDEMSVYFEELLTSQNTWIKIGAFYQACVVLDSSFEVQRQKNKRLIQYKITIRFANNDNINC